MKELHNHIFSNTTCISKETMLKFINKQLPKSELHKVETHMLDCELCTDAYEGMAYAENSSVLFAIDNQIDNRAKGGGYRTPIMRNLMLAASVLVIVFGTYFTFTFFNETINNDGNLAINEIKEDNSPFKGGERGMIFEVDNVQQELNNKIAENEPIEYTEGKDLKKETLPAPILAEQMIMDVEEDDASGELFKSIVASDDEIAVAEEVEEEFFDAVTTGNTNVIAETIRANKFYTADIASYEEIEKVSAKKAKRSTTNKSTTEKLAASAPVYANAVMRESTAKLNNSRQVTMTIEGFKVVNYLNEYQELYDAENDMTIELNSVPAGFSGKLDQEIAEKAKQEAKVEITYKETLESAMKLYKNKKYKNSQAKFHFILKKHPDEVNAQFYSGLCFYHLNEKAIAIKSFNTVLTNKETEFNEEATWYKALSLIELEKYNKAQKVLNEIVKSNGFYKIKAEEKLKEI